MTVNDYGDAPGALRPSVREVLSQMGGVGLWTGVATLLLEVGTYAAVRASGGDAASGVVAMLGVSAGWLALGAPALGAGAASGFGWLLRVGILADASGVALLVVWMLQAVGRTASCLTLASVVKCYCILVALALAGGVLPRCARSARLRCVLAVLTGACFSLVLASPFWIGGVLAGLPHSARVRVVEVAVSSNPFYGLTAALAERSGFVWHLSSVLYGVTWIGDRVPAPAVTWYAPALGLGIFAGLGALVVALRGRSRKATGGSDSGSDFGDSISAPGTL
jgi:fumarate reductase subunit D